MGARPVWRRSSPSRGDRRLLRGAAGPAHRGPSLRFAGFVDGAPVPVVVNQAFVDRYFRTNRRWAVASRSIEHPTDRSYWYPVVGIVGNERKDPLKAPVPEIIGHLRGDVPGTLTFVIRTAAPPESLVGGVRSALSSSIGRRPSSCRDRWRRWPRPRARTRFLMTLFSMFAATALVLAAIGVFGVASQAARARTREVGIRSRWARRAPGSSDRSSCAARGSRQPAWSSASPPRSPPADSSKRCCSKSNHTIR